MRQGKSHIAVLEMAKSRGYSNVIILEDDFKFLVSKEEFYTKMENLTGVYMDVFLLSYNLLGYTHSTMHPGLLRVIQAKNTTGYLICLRYCDVLIDCFEKAMTNLERTDSKHLYAIDVAWNKLQASDPWYCLTTPIGEKTV
jgi:GR25 family glycosyltransferase involved in LPS biosynthesis